MSLTTKYLTLRQKVAEVESYIEKEREDLNIKLKDRYDKLNKLQGEQLDIKLELIDSMQQEGIKTKEQDGKLISHRTKTTLKLENEEAFTKGLDKNLAKRLLKDKEIKTNDELQEYLMPRTYKIKNVTELAGRVQKVEGILLPGIQEHKTEYLTVTDKK